MAGKLIDMISQSIGSSKFSELMFAASICLICSFLFIWLWINTYENTIFSGLFTSILSQLFWCEQKRGTTWVLTHCHISSICWTQVSCHRRRQRWLLRTAAWIWNRYRLGRSQGFRKDRKVVPTELSQGYVGDTGFHQLRENQGFLFAVSKFGASMFGAWQGLWFVIVRDWLQIDQRCTSIFNLAAEDQEGHRDARHRATGEVWLGEDLHQGATRVARRAA